ncbi:MAG: Ig domain-containing protein [Bacilli bacterium]|nr:Ig domain-containing protein [Bacilli bacterium]
MKSKLLVLSAALMLVLCGCQPKSNEFVPDDNPGGGDVTTVNVESVSLNQNSATLNIGDTLQLAETVLPENATNKNVTWSASNGNVSVDDGLVTALQAGSSVVTVTTEDGNKTATCNITINEAAVEETINFSGEGDKGVNTWVYWNDQNWCGSNVAVSVHKKVGNTLTFTYTATGNCDFGFQVFYKNGSLNTGASYRLTAKINSLKAGTVKLNGTYVDLAVGDNNVAVKYVEGDGAASSFQFVVPTSMGDNTFVISDYAWEGILDIPGAISVNTTNSTISFSAVDGAASYLVKYYDSAKNYLDSETVNASGATLTKLPTTNGNYYATVTAKSSLDAKYDSIESEYTLFKVGDDAVVPAGGPRTNMTFSGEDAISPDYFYFWNDQNWCGSNVAVPVAYTEEGLVHIEYTASGSCAWGLQVFFKYSELTNGTTYAVSFKIKVAAAGSYGLGSADNVQAVTADTWTTVSYDHLEAAGQASLKLCVEASISTTNVIELKDFSWTAK